MIIECFKCDVCSREFRDKPRGSAFLKIYDEIDRCSNQIAKQHLCRQCMYQIENFLNGNQKKFTDTKTETGDVE